MSWIVTRDRFEVSNVSPEEIILLMMIMMMMMMMMIIHYYSDTPFPLHFFVSNQTMKISIRVQKTSLFCFTQSCSALPEFLLNKIFYIFVL